MANWKQWCFAPAAAALIATSCLAQSFTFTLRQPGNIAGAQFYTGGPDVYASVYLAPGNPFEATSPKGADTYYIVWSLTKFVAPPPSPPAEPLGMVGVSATAVVPISKIKLTPTGGIAIDLDVTSPEVMWALKKDCTTLPCIDSKPDSFPLKGTFEWYTGIGSTMISSSGGQETRTLQADYVNNQTCAEDRSFNGQKTSGSAKFEGTIGELNVLPPPVGPNASMDLSKGMLHINRVCSPLVTQ